MRRTHILFVSGMLATSIGLAASLATRRANSKIAPQTYIDFNGPHEVTPGATAPGAAASACGTLTRKAATPVDIYTADQYIWYDSKCAQRSTALMLSADKGGLAIQFTYQDGTIVVGEGEAGGFG